MYNTEIQNEARQEHVKIACLYHIKYICFDNELLK